MLPISLVVTSVNFCAPGHGTGQFTPFLIAVSHHDDFIHIFFVFVQQDGQVVLSRTDIYIQRNETNCLHLQGCFACGNLNGKIALIIGSNGMSIFYGNSCT